MLESLLPLKPYKNGKASEKTERDKHRDAYATHKEITKRDKETERENTERNGGTDTETQTHKETQTWIPEVHREREEMERICLIQCCYWGFVYAVLG